MTGVGVGTGNLGHSPYSWAVKVMGLGGERGVMAASLGPEEHLQLEMSLGQEREDTALCLGRAGLGSGFTCGWRWRGWGPALWGAGRVTGWGAALCLAQEQEVCAAVYSGSEAWGPGGVTPEGIREGDGLGRGC